MRVKTHGNSGFADYESEGRAFESLRERHINQGVTKVAPFSFPVGVYFGVYFRAW